MCLPLLPSTSLGSVSDVFVVPAQRWQVTQALLEWAGVLLSRVLPAAADSQDHHKEAVMVLSWLLKNSGQLGDMLDSDSDRGLYASGVDLIALGMSIAAGAASWCATSAEHDACLQHLSLCLGSAINVVSLAIQVTNGCQNVESDDGQLAAGTHEQAMMHDLSNCVLDVLCGGWAVSAPDRAQEPARIRALSSLLEYAALPDEAALSEAALRLLLRLSHSAERDAEVVHAFLYDCSVTQRRSIAQGLAAWLQQCVSGQKVAGGDAGATASDVAALVLRLLLRSVDTLIETAARKGNEPWQLIMDPAEHGENLAVALLGLYQDHHHLYQDPQGSAHLLLDMVLQVADSVPWTSIQFVEASLSEDANLQGLGGAVNENLEPGSDADTARDLRVYQLSHDCMRLIYTLSSSGLLPLKDLRPPSAGDKLVRVIASMCGQWGRGLAGAQSLAKLRGEMARGKSGAWLGDNVSHELPVLFGGGLLHLTLPEAVRRWQHGAQLLTHLITNAEAEALVRSYVATRARLQRVEEYLEEAVEGQLLFLHQNGWLLRSLAVLMRHADAASLSLALPLLPSASLALSPGDPGREEAPLSVALRRVLGVPTEGASSWAMGLLHKILREVLDVHAIEGAGGSNRDNEAVHPSLSRDDLQGSFTLKDKWSQQPICYDAEALTAVLAARIKNPPRHQEQGAPASAETQSLQAAAAACVDARVLSPYDGYNTLQRLQSARQHVMCGLRDCLQALLSQLEVRCVPYSVSRLPFSYPIAHSPYSIAHIPFSLLRIAHSAFRTAYCVLRIPQFLWLVQPSQVSRAARQPAETQAAVTLLYDLVHEHLVPHFPKEKAGAHLEVAVHSSVLVCQAIEGIGALVPPQAEGCEGGGYESAGRFATEWRRQLSQLLDEVLGLLERWGPPGGPLRLAVAAHVHDQEEAGDAEAGTAKIASGMIRRELYASFLALVRCLAVEHVVDNRAMLRLGPDTEKIVEDRREALLPIVMADVLSQVDYEEASGVGLLALRVAVHVMPLSVRGGGVSGFIGSRPDAALASSGGGGGGGGGSSSSGVLSPYANKSQSMAFSKVGRSSLRAASHLRAAPAALTAILQQTALAAHLCADFAGKTTLADVVHAGEGDGSGTNSLPPQLEIFLAKVELLKAIAAHPLGREHLRDAGALQTICASPVLSAAMSSGSRARTLLCSNGAGAAGGSGWDGASLMHRKTAHFLVLGTLDAVMSLLTAVTAGSVAAHSLAGDAAQRTSTSHSSSRLHTSATNLSGWGGRSGSDSLSTRSYSAEGVAGAVAESLIRFVWTNREVFEAILSDPLPAPAPAPDGVPSAHSPGAGSPGRIVPYAKGGRGGAAAHDAMEDVAADGFGGGDAGAGNGGGGGVGELEVVLGKERLLLARLLEAMSRTGALDVPLSAPAPDARQVLFIGIEYARRVSIRK